MSEASVTSSADVASSSATSPQVAFEIGDTEADRTLDGTRSSLNQRLEESRLRHIAKSIGKLAVGLSETSAERFVFWAIAVILACLGLWVALRQTAISEWTAKKDYWEHCQDSQHTEEACEKAKTTPLEPPPVSLPWGRPKVRGLQQANTQPIDTFPGFAIVFVGFPVIIATWLPFRRRINRALRRPLRFTLAGSQPLPPQPRFLVMPEERIPITTLNLSTHSISTSTGIEPVHSLTELRVMDVSGIDSSLKLRANNEMIPKVTSFITISQAHDAWSLGFICFEMLVWILLGKAGVCFEVKAGSWSTISRRLLGKLRMVTF